MVYTERLKQVGRDCLISYGISFLIIFVWNVIAGIRGGSLNLIPIFANCTVGSLFLGTPILLYRTNETDCMPAICSSGIHMLGGLGSTILGAVCSFNPVLIALGFIEAMIWAFFGCILLLYMAFCFPLNLLNLTVMTILEHMGHNPADGIGEITDLMVPVLAGILSVIVVIRIFFLH